MCNPRRFTVKVKGQHTGISSLLTTYGSGGSTSHCQVQWSALTHWVVLLTLWARFYVIAPLKTSSPNIPTFWATGRWNFTEKFGKWAQLRPQYLAHHGLWGKNNSRFMQSLTLKCWVLDRHSYKAKRSQFGIEFYQSHHKSIPTKKMVSNFFPHHSLAMLKALDSSFVSKWVMPTWYTYCITPWDQGCQMFNITVYRQCPLLIPTFPGTSGALVWIAMAPCGSIFECLVIREQCF